MEATGWHLAQVNIAVLSAPLDSPQLAGFVSMLEPINRLADSAPGFVWRLQTEDGDATAIRPFGDDRMMVNMSVWENVESLGAFVYRTRHLDVMRHRREWFDKMTRSYLALWWIPVGTIPTVEEAKRRLQILDTVGPSTEAFTFKEPFPPPDSTDQLRRDDRWSCPTG